MNKFLYPHYALMGVVFLIMGCQKEGSKKPPQADIIQKETVIHGDSLRDNYYWLRDRDNPKVIDYLKAENDYTESIMQHTKPLQEKLYKEMLGRIKEIDIEVPTRHGRYFYYKRTEEGKQYPIHCRKKDGLDAEEEIILDQNKQAATHKYFSIGAFKISPNHNLLAFSADTTGSEKFTVYVKNLTTGNIQIEAQKTSYDLEWANDNSTLFYTTMDETHRPDKLFRHKLGSPQNEDKLLHLEEDDAYYLEISKTKSGAFIFLTVESQVTSEVWYLNTNQANGKFRVIHPRQHKMEYMVEHHEDNFLILTNDNAIDFKLMQVSAKSPGKKNWQEIIPHKKFVKLDHVESFKNFIVLYLRQNGLEKILIRNMHTGESHFVNFEEPAYDIKKTKNPEFDTNNLRFTYSSFVTPKSVFDYNMQTKTKTLKKQEEVLGVYDPARYFTDRIFAEAADGTKIPISLVYKKGLEMNGSNPALLYGYGAYGLTRSASFSSKLLSLLDRGFIYAIAHVRGSGTMGRSWYKDGKFFNKKNTFTDFIACAEHLIKTGHASKEKLAIYGASAGGLLVGAATNIRPDLFKAVVAKVPFVDIINTMLDETIPLTVIEWEEWGNPNQKDYYEYMLSYSPYDNVKPKAYPNMLITAGLNDPRVCYWEPAKWTAKLRAAKTNNNVLILKTNMGAGHFSATGRYNYLKEVAFEYAFLIDIMGIKG